MTAKELIERLAMFDPETRVVVGGDVTAAEVDRQVVDVTEEDDTLYIEVA